MITDMLRDPAALPDGPDLWKILLPPVMEAYGDAVVAGGAVRDWRLGVPHKDVDIFVPVDDREALRTGLSRLPEWMQLESLSRADEEAYEAGLEACEVRGVTEGHAYHESGWSTLVQVVGVHRPAWSTPEALVARFDFGVNRSAYSRPAPDLWRLLDTQEAADDRAARTATLLYAEDADRAEHSRRRLGNLNHRLRELRTGVYLRLVDHPVYGLEKELFA